MNRFKPKSTCDFATTSKYWKRLRVGGGGMKAEGEVDVRLSFVHNK
jgi:hypothetical protein